MIENIVGFTSLCPIVH